MGLIAAEQNFELYYHDVYVLLKDKYLHLRWLRKKGISILKS